MPSTRPVAETALLQAGVAAKGGNAARAVELCRIGAALLRELRSGTNPALLEPCLASYAAEADRRPGDRQALLGQMFETAELAQDSVTSREIDEAAVRLAANARDPKVAEAIRRRQDAGDRLADLYRERDTLTGNAPPGSVSLGAPTSAADLDKRITDAQADLADADAALQTASPFPPPPPPPPPPCSVHSGRTRRWPPSRSLRTVAGVSCCAQAPSMPRR